MPNQYATSAGMRRGSVVTLKASGAQTSSTNGGAVDAGGGSTATVTVNVTAASGTTPTMTVAIQGSADGTNWVTLGTIGAGGYSVGTTDSAPSNFTASATSRAVFPAPQFLRYASTIGGSTHSFTYSVTAAVS